MAESGSGQHEQQHDPGGHVRSGPVPESPKTTIRWDEGLKADAERCAKDRGIAVAEFVRQSITHYVSWCAAQKEREDDQEKDA